MAVRAWLEGAQPDLDALARLLSGSDIQLHKDVDDERHTYYLTAPVLDACTNASDYFEVGKQLITSLNGLTRVGNPRYRPVQMADRYTDDGGKNHAFGTIAPLEFRIVTASFSGEVVYPDGQRPEAPVPQSVVPRRLSLALSNPDVAEVLRLMGREGSLTWSDLYKVHEIIRDSIKPTKLMDLGWTDKITDSAFTGSANRADVSGDDARHARNPGPAPKHTMTIDQGRSFISGLVEKWLSYLTAQGDAVSRASE